MYLAKHATDVRIHGKYKSESIKETVRIFTLRTMILVNQLYILKCYDLVKISGGLLVRASYVTIRIKRTSTYSCGHARTLGVFIYNLCTPMMGPIL